MKDAVKVLILTLGTGNIFGRDGDSLTPEEVERRIKEREFVYRLADYQISGESEVIRSEFVAEPLIRAFQPDKIFILGTVKSDWTSFYGKFGDEDAGHIRELYEIRQRYGKDIAGEELGKVSERINAIFRDSLTKPPFSGYADVHVILTRYGLSDEELLENYQLLSGIWKDFDTDKHYEAAFDITHSFRSLPLYNLVILNYFKSISQMELKISHVYYGNIDVSRENNDIASIVDLRDLVEVLDLTGSVSEFKNTGNASSLLALIPESESALRNALERFDWATQSNALDRIEESLKELFAETERKDGEEMNRYADLRDMIRQVLALKFFEENGIETGSAAEIADSIEGLPVEEKQFMICKWYFNQNRYGQALATGQETLKSFLVPLYLSNKGKDVTPENCRNMGLRDAAIAHLDRIAGDLEGEPEDSLEYFFFELNRCRECARSVRNSFAHNLMENITPQCSKCVGGSEDFYCAKRITESFIRMLSRLHEELRDNGQAVRELYARQPGHVVPEHDAKKARRLIISNQAEDFQEYISKKKKGEVYRLDESICKRLAAEKGEKDHVVNALLLAEYIRKWHFEDDDIIFHHLKTPQLIYYYMILRKQGIKKLYIMENRENSRLERLPDSSLEMQGELLEENEPGGKIRELLIPKPIEVKKEDDRPFINFSNHGFKEWSDEQKEKAQKYGKLMYCKFPQVAPDAAEHELKALSAEQVRRICEQKPAAVMCQGEAVLTHMVVRELKKRGITVLAACSERVAEEIKNPDGSVTKTSNFKFVGFRKYL